MAANKLRFPSFRESFMKKITFIFFVASILSACQSIPLQLTVTPEVSPTLSLTNTPTAEPRPTATFTPTPISLSPEKLATMSDEEKLAEAPEVTGYTVFRTAERYVLYENSDGVRDLAYDISTGEKVEIPKYKICSNERFYDCEITKEDLLNGKYWLWLNTLDVKFDPTKVKDVPFVVDTNEYSSSWVDRTSVYQDSGHELVPDFSDPSTAPFARNVTSGVVLFIDNGINTFDAVRPLFFYNKEKDITYPIISIQSYYNNQPGQESDPRSGLYIKNLNNWLKNYKVTPLAVGCYTYNGQRMCSFSLVSGATDPILVETEKIYPDIEARLIEFATGDYAVLSKPGLIVQTTSDAYPNDNRYR